MGKHRKPTAVVAARRQLALAGLGVVAVGGVLSSQLGTPATTHDDSAQAGHIGIPSVLNVERSASSSHSLTPSHVTRRATSTTAVRTVADATPAPAASPAPTAATGSPAAPSVTRQATQGAATAAHTTGSPVTTPTSQPAPSTQQQPVEGSRNSAPVAKQPPAETTTQQGPLGSVVSGILGVVTSPLQNLAPHDVAQSTNAMPTMSGTLH
ncbi:MAG: hypothetical protein ACRDRN_15680 [Sciscionella sp.]